jgi:hypothetical protein
MIRIKIACLLTMVVVVSALAGAQSRGRSKVKPAFYNKPAELKLDRVIWRHFAGYRKQYQGQAFALEGFYPIGWSRDGKFAYYYEPDGGDCDCYIAKLMILNLKSDSVAWLFEYNSGGLEEAKKEGKPYSQDTLWVANQRLFFDKLRAHGIEQQLRFGWSSFPIHFKGDRLVASLKTHPKPGLTEDERVYGVVGTATSQLTSRRHGTKTIFKHSYDDTRPLFVADVGYLKSPFEPRIAVALVEIYRGWEGPPHAGHVKLVGASLDTGFK